MRSTRSRTARIRAFAVGLAALVLIPGGAGISGLRAAEPSPPPSSGSRVIGGSAAAPGQIPFQVYVFSESRNSLCGGSLVAASVVVTAAHCVDPSPPADTLVVGGTTKLDGSGVVRAITGGVIHPAWDPNTTANDLAVLFLAQPMPLGAAIATIQIAWPGLDHLYDPGELVRVSGWGRTQSGPPPGPSALDLQFADLPVVNSATCANIWTSISAGNVVCTGSPNAPQSPCQGDSGGPLTTFDPARNRTYLIGVVSFGTRECVTTRPAVFTKVASYASFLDQHIGSVPPRVVFSASSPCGSVVAVPALRFGPGVAVEVSASAPSGETVTLSSSSLPAWAQFSSATGNPATGTLTASPGLIDWLVQIFGAPTTVRIMGAASTADVSCDVQLRVSLF